MNKEDDNKKDIMDEIYESLNEPNREILILLAKTVKVTQESIKNHQPQKTA